jgi:hypothetical protein
LCVIKKPREGGGSGPLRAVVPKTNKQTIFCGVMPCNLVDRCHQSGGAYCLHILGRCRNFSVSLPHYTASHLRPPHCLHSRRRERRISANRYTPRHIFGESFSTQEHVERIGSDCRQITCKSWSSPTRRTHWYSIWLSKYF